MCTYYTHVDIQVSFDLKLDLKVVLVNGAGKIEANGRYNSDRLFRGQTLFRRYYGILEGTIRY